MSTSADRPTWAETWTFFERNRREIIRAIASTMPHSADDVLDLVHDFAIRRLPLVIEHTREMADTNAAPYLRAAVRNFALDAWRRSAREQHALRELAAVWAISAATEQSPDMLHADLPDLELPALHQKALAQYFGLSGTPRSLRDIASTLNLSRYAAATTVVDALAAAALTLGRHGTLAPREVGACRAVLLDGVAIAAAATSFGLGTERLRKVLCKVRAAGLEAVRRSQRANWTSRSRRQGRSDSNASVLEDGVLSRSEVDRPSTKESDPGHDVRQAQRGKRP